MSSCCMLMWFSFVSILWRFQRGDVLHTSLGRSLHLPPAFRSSPDSLSHNHSSFDQLLHHTIGKDGGQSSLFLISGWCRQSKKGGCRTLQSLQLWIWPLLPHPLHANPGHLHPVHLHLPHQLVHRQLGQPHPLPCPWILGTHPWPSRQCHRYYFCIIFFSFPSLLSAIAQPLIPWLPYFRR